MDSRLTTRMAPVLVAAFAGHAAAQNGSILVIEDSFNGAGIRVTPALQAAGWSVTETSDVPTGNCALPRRAEAR